MHTRPGKSQMALPFLEKEKLCNGGTLVTTEESMKGWLISTLKPRMPGFLDKSLDVWVKNLENKAEGRTANG